MLEAAAQDRFLVGLIALGIGLSLPLLSIAIYVTKVKGQVKDLLGDKHNLSGSIILGRAIREWYYEVLRPFVEYFIRRGITPNTLSTIGFGFALATFVLFGLGLIGPAGWFVLLSGTFDIFDGAVARKTESGTRHGAFYDSILDRYGDMIVHFGILFYYMQSEKSPFSWMVWVVLASIVGTNVVSYAKARAESVGIEVTIGTMQRPERFVFLGFGAIFSCIIQAILAPWIPQHHHIFAGAVIFIAIMANITAIQRIRYALKALKQRNDE